MTSAGERGQSRYLELRRAEYAGALEDAAEAEADPGRKNPRPAGDPSNWTAIASTATL